MKKAFRIGTISLVFLIIGFQTALLVSRASILYIEAKRDRPDTVFVYTAKDSPLFDEPSLRTSEIIYSGNESVTAKDSPSLRTSEASVAIYSGNGTENQEIVRHDAPHSEIVKQIRYKTRKVENFRFDPNTASSEEFQRLGFSEKQAASILNYRNKGGRFRRPSDFAKSFVVSDSVFRRLEPYIDIPKIDINTADSLELITLPGIGGYFASKIIQYRTRLKGFSYPEQLMDIKNIDSERFESFCDLITCSLPEPYELWSLAADSLRKHPYIEESADAIILFKENTDVSQWKIESLHSEGILSDENSEKLSKCFIKSVPLLD